MFGTLSGLISMKGAFWSCALQWPLRIADFQHKFQIFEAKHFLPSPLLKSYSAIIGMRIMALVEMVVVILISVKINRLKKYSCKIL